MRFQRGPAVLAALTASAVAALLALLPVRALAQTTYTWNKTTANSWTTSSNWTPTRTTPQTSDILVIDGATTPTPTLTSVPTQTIGRLRIINNANVTMQSSGSVTLTITGGVAPNLDIAKGSALTLAGSTSQPITMNLTGSATAAIAGSVTFNTNAHRLLGAAASAIQFLAGGSFTTGTGFSGNPFGSSGTANSVVFQAGSVYTQNAGLDPFGLTAPNSIVVFQRGSKAVFRTTSGFVADGRTYANLTAQNNVALTTSGSGNFQVDTLVVESGSSFSRTQTSTSTITLRGDISSAGTGAVTLTPGTGGLQINGGVVQNIGIGGGTGAITFGGNATIASGTTVAVSRTLTFSSGTMTVNGAFRIDQGGGVSGSNFSYGSGASLIFNNSSGSITVASTSPYWPAASGPTNVTVQGAGGITMGSGATRTVTGTLQTSAAIASANLLTLSGTFQINAGGSVTGSPTYSGTATLLYATGATVGSEWAAGTSVGVGVPDHVTLQAGAGTVTLPSGDRSVPGNLTITSGTLAAGATSGNLIVTGNVTISSGASLAMNATSGNLSVGGNWSDAGTFTANGRKVTFTGSGTQTLSRGGGEAFATLALSKTGGSVQLGSAVAASPTGGANALEFNGTTDVLDLNGQTLTLSGPLAGSDASGSIKGSATSSLALSGTGPLGTLTLTSGSQTLSNLSVNATGAGGNLTLGTPVTVGGTL